MNNQNENKFDSQEVNNSVDAQKQNVDVSQEVKTILNGKSNIADAPWTPDQEDLLRMEPFRNAIIDYIRNSDTPFNIALQGERGCGKTSIMKSVKGSLCDCENPQFYCVWVDAWKFTVVNSAFKIITDILKMMIEQIKVLIPKYWLYQKAIDSVEYTITLLDILATINIEEEDSPAKSLWGRVVKGVKLCYSVIKNEPADRSAFIEQLKLNITKLVRDVIESSHNDGLNYKKSFIFFVDHLDRVNPTLALEVIELIKNLFDVKYCIFVVAFDYNFIVKGLESRIGKINGENACQYMHFLDDKFQAVIPINIGFSDSELFVKKMRQIVLLDDNKLSLAELDDLNLIVRLSVGANPSNLKRLINKFAFLRLFSLHSDQYGVDQIDQYLTKHMNIKDIQKVRFILCCIQVAYPEIYMILELRPYFIGWDKRFVYQMIPQNDSNEILLRNVFSNIADDASSENGVNLWKNVLFCLCYQLTHLRSNYDKIRILFEKIDGVFRNTKSDGDYEDLITAMFGYIDSENGIYKSWSSLVKPESSE